MQWRQIQIPLKIIRRPRLHNIFLERAKALGYLRADCEHQSKLGVSESQKATCSAETHIINHGLRVQNWTFTVDWINCHQDEETESSPIPQVT